jgi:hypothetical protein
MRLPVCKRWPSSVGSGPLTRIVSVSVVGVVVLVLLGTGLGSARAAAGSAAQELAEKYSPIMMFRKQTEVCDKSQEQYAPPTSVNVVLGNRRVRLLHRVGHHMRLVKRGPRAADMAGRGPSYYLDLPGDPLLPGCKYAKDFRALRRAGRAPPVTYAHIAREQGVPGFALQFWFYYYFNQFNDVHESDWEGMQLWFEARSPQQALRTQPAEIVVFQHAGGERSDWDDSKVETDGTHPVVYSAAGSHATFYGSALWLGNGQGGSGVGCDNTTGPLISVRPRAVLLPQVPPKYGPFAWLSYTGHWGQREAGFNNGPAGPNTKLVWRYPFTWMATTRTASPIVPAGSIAGPAVSGLFCFAVAQVTGYMNLAAKTLPGAIGVGLACLLIVTVPILLTTWRPVVVRPLSSHRAVGQVLLAAAALCTRKRRTMALVSITCLGLIASLNVLQYLVRVPFGGHGTFSLNSSQGSAGVFTSAGIGEPVVEPIAIGLTIAVVRCLELGEPTGYPHIWGTLLRRFWRMFFVQWLMIGVAGIMALVIVGTGSAIYAGLNKNAIGLGALLIAIVFGIGYPVYKFVHWSLAAQVAMFEDVSLLQAMKGSTRVVKSHWWHTALCTGVLYLIAEIPGPLIGFALLFAPVKAEIVNLIGALIWSLMLPYASVGRSLVYLDLRERPQAGKVAAQPIVADAPAV